MNVQDRLPADHFFYPAAGLIARGNATALENEKSFPHTRCNGPKLLPPGVCRVAVSGRYWMKETPKTGGPEGGIGRRANQRTIGLPEVRQFLDNLSHGTPRCLARCDGDGRYGHQRPVIIPPASHSGKKNFRRFSGPPHRPNRKLCGASQRIPAWLSSPRNIPPHHNP